MEDGITIQCPTLYISLNGSNVSIKDRYKKYEQLLDNHDQVSYVKAWMYHGSNA